MSPRLRFHQDQIAALANRYQYQLDDANLMELQASILERGYLTKGEIKKIAYWKAARSATHADKNQPSYVTEITGFALATEDERARIQSLTLWMVFLGRRPRLFYIYSIEIHIPSWISAHFGRCHLTCRFSMGLTFGCLT